MKPATSCQDVYCEVKKESGGQAFPSMTIRLLLVDDNPDDAVLTIDRLGSVAPATYIVTWADTFDRARGLLVGNRFDACLIDYHLGRESGLALLAEAEAQGVTAPIILVTGRVDDAVDGAAMRAGAAGFLVKGEFEGAALDRALRYAIAQRTAELNLRVVAAAIVDGACDAIISMTLSGVITSWNRSAERIYGLEASHVIGASVDVLTPPPQTDDFSAVMARVRRGESITQHETVWTSQQGEQAHLSITATPTRSRTGEPIGLSFVSRDISVDRRAETVLRQSRDLLKIVVEGVPDAIFLEDLEGRYLMCNAVGAALAGRTVDQVVGRRGSELFPQHAQLIRDRARQVIDSGQTLTLQDELIVGGIPRTFLVTRSPLRSDGATVGVLVVGHEITDRKRSEEALMVSAASLARAQELAHLGNWEFDVESGKGQCSIEARRIFGLSDPESVSSATLMDRVHPDDRVVADRALDNLLTRQEPYNQDLRIVHLDGETRVVNVQNHVLRDLSGQPVQIQGTVLDVTARKKIEAALRLSDEQLRQAQKMDAIGRLAGGVAHDFNNMLSVINGYASMLLSGPPLPEMLQTPLAEILEAGERAASLTRQLLVFSRKQEVQLRPLNVNKALVGIESMLRCMIGEEIILLTDFSPEVGFTQADPVQLDQIMINLAVNARDAMPGGGTLQMTSRVVVVDDEAHHPDAVPCGTYIQVTVSDTGCGMAESVKAHIFEPFFTTRPEGQGTGLGLATVYGIVKQLGGYIDVRTVQTCGSSFDIYLRPVPGPLETCHDEPSSPQLRGSETILVLEDEASVRVLIRSILVGYGYRVLEAGHGEEAVRQASREEGPIHLLLTDVMLAGETGREVAARLTNLRPEMRVIFMSAYSADMVIRKGAFSPGTPLLEKPVLPTALVRKVREVLDAEVELVPAPGMRSL